MCNLRVIPSSENMVTSTRTEPQRLGCKSHSANSTPSTPSQSPRGKSSQFSKSPSPTGSSKGKQGKGRGYPSNLSTPKKSSVARCHSSPMSMPARQTSSPQGRGSGYGSPLRYGSPQLSSSFAGSKCFEPPTPSSLPKPPTDWFASTVSDGHRCTEIRRFDVDYEEVKLSTFDLDADICTQLKFLLKVAA